MNKIEFENGSIIESFKSESSTRGIRSSVISFYCSLCHTIHVDYPVSKFMFITEDIQICKDGYDNILEPYINSTTKG